MEGAPRDERELDERLSRPPDQLIDALAGAPGDIIVLGAGGKMGPSLTRMAKRAAPDRRVIAVSRWSDEKAAVSLAALGVEIIIADLLNPVAVELLPGAANVVFMAGQKFGTSGNPSATWAMNAAVPAFASERYAGSRTVVFSTGNVYPLSQPSRGGSTEYDEPAPIGEYAYSCLARERLFTAAAARHRSPVSIIRLNYAHDLRYGVLTDLASRIAAGQPIDLRMSYVNVIWQGDANAVALASLARATAPEPYILNVAGPATLRVADLAHRIGERLGIKPVFAGEERADALLSNGARMAEALDAELLPLETLLDWVTGWIQHGGRLLGKPTGFEKRDGHF
ncbi:MAG: NAD-dependent epimerase/dehydratase family protein [Gemmatimonadota bacterium]